LGSEVVLEKKGKFFLGPLGGDGVPRKMQTEECE
jgi:hypothetical protein